MTASACDTESCWAIPLRVSAQASTTFRRRAAPRPPSRPCPRPCASNDWTIGALDIPRARLTNPPMIRRRFTPTNVASGRLGHKVVTVTDAGRRCSFAAANRRHYLLPTRVDSMTHSGTSQATHHYKLFILLYLEAERWV